MKAEISKWMYIIPTICFLLALGIFPIIYAIFLAFTGFELGAAKYEFVGFENFYNIAFDDEFLLTLINTTLITLGGVSLQLLFGLMLALMLNVQKKGIRIIRGIFLLPMVLSPVVVGIIFRLILHTDFGPVNYIFEQIGIPPQPWRESPSLALFTVILIDTWQWAPFVGAILLAGLQGVPSEIFEAAQVDGASEFQRFRYLTLPLLTPLITTAVLLRGIDLFKMFDLVYTYTFGGPANATETISMYIWKLATKFFRLGYGSATSFTLFLIITIVVIIYIQRLRKV